MDINQENKLDVDDKAMESSEALSHNEMEMEVEEISQFPDIETSQSMTTLTTENQILNVPTATASQNENGNESCGLNLIAQYESDTEDIATPNLTDSVAEIRMPDGCDTYRSEVIVSDSSSSDSDDDPDCQYLTTLRKEIDKSTQHTDDEDDDFEENKGKRQPLKVKGEMSLEDLPPLENLQITVPEEECVELGRIQSIVDQLVLVNVLPNSILLDLETVLFLEKGKKVLGAVFDVLGQVTDPLYCVRFNTNKEIKDRKINVGDVVYCAPKTQHTQFVILSKLMNVRGSDASWENDIEPPPRHLDYSDDEEERQARNKRRDKDRPTNDDRSNRKRTNVAASNNIGRPFSGEQIHKNQDHNIRTTQESSRMDTGANNNAGINLYNSSSWHSNYNHYSHPSLPHSLPTYHHQYSGHMATLGNLQPSQPYPYPSNYPYSTNYPFPSNHPNPSNSPYLSNFQYPSNTPNPSHYPSPSNLHYPSNYPYPSNFPYPASDPHQANQPHSGNHPHQANHPHPANQPHPANNPHQANP